jgi:hypothetical protein
VFYAISILVCGGYAIAMLRKRFSDKLPAFSEVQTEKTLLTFSAVLMILLIPVGSGYGIGSVHGDFETLAFPLACALIWDFTKTYRDKKIVALGKKIPCAVSHVTIVLLLLAFAIINIKRRPIMFFNDPGPVSSKTHFIENKHFRHIRTSLRMEQNINGLLVELNRHLQLNSSLMSYDSIPLVNFLTETDSYVKNSWIWIYTQKVLERELQLSEKKRQGLPVILIQKRRSVVRAENNQLDPNYFLPIRRDDAWGAKERYFTFKHFMDKHKYERHWGNEFFDVWLPKKGGPL